MGKIASETGTTIYAWALMTNHAHIINTHQGHGQIAAGCMPQVIADFINAADPSGLDDSCMERAFVMPFFVDFSGPLP